MRALRHDHDDRPRGGARRNRPGVRRHLVATLLVLLAALITLLSGPSAAAYTGHTDAGLSASVEGTSPHGDDGRLRVAAGPAQPAHPTVVGNASPIVPPGVLLLGSAGDLDVPTAAAPQPRPWEGRAPPVAAAP